VEADSSPWRAILTFCGAVHLLVRNPHVSAALHEANELVWSVHKLRHVPLGSDQGVGQGQERERAGRHAVPGSRVSRRRVQCQHSARYACLLFDSVMACERAWGRAPMRRTVFWGLVVILLLAPSFAVAQAGSTGGTIGKTDKSASGGEDLRATH